VFEDNDMMRIELLHRVAVQLVRVCGCDEVWGRLGESELEIGLWPASARAETRSGASAPAFGRQTRNNSETDHTPAPHSPRTDTPPSVSSPTSPTPINTPDRMEVAPGSGAGPEAGPSTGQDLWGSILDSVKSSRAVATKNLIVLGKAPG